MQKAFDELYQQSKNGNNFYKLLEIIGSEQNICLAYRNLKTNSGSKTAGTDGKTIEDIKGLSDREVIETVRKQLADYHPQSVRRVFIPKPGSDKKRPLGRCIYAQKKCAIDSSDGDNRLWYSSIDNDLPIL